MRVLFLICLVNIILLGTGFAQEQKVTQATVALQSILSSFKTSIEKLSLDNDQLRVKDEALKADIVKLQGRLDQLQAEAGDLNKAMDKLQFQNPRRAKEINRLEGENFNLDNRIQKNEADITLLQHAIDVEYQQYQRLLLELKDKEHKLSNPDGASGGVSKDAARVQKEKLILLKMIDQSQQRQEALHVSIINFQKNTPLLPVVAAMERQEVLKKQINDATTALAAYGQKTQSATTGNLDQLDNRQLAQLEEDQRALEHNYAQLKDLVGTMTAKVKKSNLTVDQHVEEIKLQNSIKDLNHQGLRLRAELDDLRSQMIDLDKRKSRLETMIN